MEYTEEILIKIEEYAGLLTSISDIAVLLDINEDELRDDIALKTTQVSLRYRKAKASTELQLRRQEIDLAKLGSPIAIDLVQKYKLNQQIS
jgi:hypothetical protein